MTLQELYTYCDTHLAAALSLPGNQHCCSAGCFHCCREPAYGTAGQIHFLLETYPKNQLTELKRKVLHWRNEFRGADFHKQHRPNAFLYRSFRIWCPLLDQATGLCSVYDRRPLECRIHFAKGSPEGCRDDVLRRKQQFLTARGTLAEILNRIVAAIPEGEVETFDHLGILLYNALFDQQEWTPAGFRIRKTADGAEMLDICNKPLVSLEKQYAENESS